MTAPLAPLAQRFRFNEQLLHVATDGLPEEAWRRAPDGGGNTAQWILGHLVMARRGLLRMAGAECPEEPWEKAFGMGVKPSPDDIHPPVEDLRARFQAAGEALETTLGELSAEVLQQPLPKPFPDGSDRLEGGAHFLYMHEVYHLGQLGLIRRMAGLPGFA